MLLPAARAAGKICFALTTAPELCNKRRGAGFVPAQTVFFGSGYISNSKAGTCEFNAILQPPSTHVMEGPGTKEPTASLWAFLRLRRTIGKRWIFSEKSIILMA
jgi:hypothetical protein